MSINSPIFVKLIGFTPSTKTLLKSTFASYTRKGRSFSEHEGSDVPSLYLLDGDNAEACSIWRSGYPNKLDAPAVAIGQAPFSMDIPVMKKPLKWGDLYDVLVANVDKKPPEFNGGSTKTIPTGSVQNGLITGTQSESNVLRKKLLVVDDSATVRHYMSIKLAPFGFGLDYAESGEIAVSKAETYPYEAVFLDVVMPGWDGYETCKKLRTILKTSTPIIMVTTRDSPFDKMRGTLAGCTAYLVKPLDEKAISEAMTKWLKATPKR